LDNHQAFDTSIGRVGLLICWDLAFPEAFRKLISQGAKLIIVPAFWLISDSTWAGHGINSKSDVLFTQSCVTARAFENTCGKLMIIHFNHRC